MRFLKPLLFFLPGFFLSVALHSGDTAAVDPAELEHTRYLQTVERMKLIVQGCEGFNTDNNSYPPADSIETLKKALTPDYLSADSIWVDGWDQPFHYARWDEPEPGRASSFIVSDCAQDPPEPGCKNTVITSPPEPIHHWHMMIASAGADGIWEKDNLREYAERWTSSPEEDLVMRDGEWLRRMKPAPEDWREAMKETQRRLWSVKSAITSYEMDNNHLPDAASLDALVALLQPDYLPSGFAAKHDGWGHSLRFLRWQDPLTTDGLPGKIHYRIASAGADGKFERDDLRAYSARESTDPREDLLIENGYILSDYLDPQMDDKARARRTMGKIKTIATVIEQLATDQKGRYPSGDDISGVLRLLTSSQETSAGLGYAFELMKVDGWRKPIRYFSWNEKPRNVSGSDHYCLASAGPDGRLQFSDLSRYFSPAGIVKGDESDDVVICDGQFVRQPID